MLNNDLYHKFIIKILTEHTTFNCKIDNIENNKIYVLKNTETKNLINMPCLGLILIKKNLIKDITLNISAQSITEDEKYLKIHFCKGNFEKLWGFIVKNSKSEEIENIFLNNFLSIEQDEKSINSLLSDITKEDFIALAKEFLDINDIVLISSNSEKLLYSKDLINYDTQKINHYNIYFKSKKDESIDPNKLDLFFKLFEKHYSNLNSKGNT